MGDSPVGLGPGISASEGYRVATSGGRPQYLTMEEDYFS